MVNENDDWSADGPSILNPEALANIKAILEKKGPVILQHKFYRGARGPKTLGFDDYDDFLTYLKSHARPDDKFTVWDFAELCRDDNGLAFGKYPDALGRTPRLGAY